MPLCYPADITPEMILKFRKHTQQNQTAPSGSMDYNGGDEGPMKPNGVLKQNE